MRSPPCRARRPALQGESAGPWQPAASNPPCVTRRHGVHVRSRHRPLSRKLAPCAPWPGSSHHAAAGRAAGCRVSGSGPRLVAGHVLRVHHGLALAVPVRQRAAQRVVPQRVPRPARLPRGQVARKAPLRERVSAIARRGRVERVVAPDVDLRPPRGAASAAAHAMCRGTVQRRSAAGTHLSPTRGLHRYTQRWVERPGGQRKHLPSFLSVKINAVRG